jgi:hypothetical protein
MDVLIENLHLIAKLRRALTFAEFTCEELLSLGAKVIGIMRPDLVRICGNELPAAIKEQPEVIMLLCCPGHNEKTTGDQFDGPNPSVKDCSRCRKELLIHRPDVLFHFFTV